MKFLFKNKEKRASNSYNTNILNSINSYSSINSTITIYNIIIIKLTVRINIFIRK